VHIPLTLLVGSCLHFGLFFPPVTNRECLQLPRITPHTQKLVHSPLLPVISTDPRLTATFYNPTTSYLSRLVITMPASSIVSRSCIGSDVTNVYLWFANNIHYGFKAFDSPKPADISFYTDSNARCAKMIFNILILGNLIIHQHITSAKSGIRNKRGIFSPGCRGQG
jgi:hypothetical protein